MSLIMTETEATHILGEGTAILNTVLAPHGFAVSSIISGKSSGGPYASCEFTRGNRRFRLSFRHSLGLVEYEVGDMLLSHEDFMWSMLGSRGAAHYPEFSGEPLDAFRHLAADLGKYGQSFLTGNDEDFAGRVSHAAALRASAPRLPE
jgi:hypothetical protein